MNGTEDILNDLEYSILISQVIVGKVISGFISDLELDATTTPKRSADWYAKVVATNCAPGTQEYCFPQELPGDNSTDIPSTETVSTEAPADTDAPGGDGSSAVAIVASTVLSALLSLL